jgi:sensor histidine kinase regulating citrate/malate metabolism
MVKNAIEASPHGSVITLECSLKSESLLFAVSNPGFMPRENQLQVFKRSFSTKGKGRGIGTFSMKLFGEKYLKGKVRFNSDLDFGTTFYLELPLNHPEKPAWG